jgi:putative inorganic carbon (hco3(-)) transporter
MESTSRGHWYPPAGLARFGEMSALAAALIAAAAAGVVLAGGQIREAVLFPAAAAMAVTLGFLVFARFELFVICILTTRASLDALKFAGPAGLDPAGALSVVFLVTGSVWLLTRPASLREAPTLLARPLIALTAAGALSIAISRDTAGATQDVVRLATLVVIVLVLNQILVSVQRLKLLLAAIFVSALPPMLMGAYQMASGTGLHRSASFDRVESTFAHPNPFAMYLTLLIVLGVALFPYVGYRLKITLIFFLAASGGFLLLTYTRSAWIATAAGLLVVGLCHGKKVLGVAGLVVVLVVLTVPGVAARFQDLEVTATSSGAPANSLVWRLGYWNQALELSDSPLLGEGLRAVRASIDVQKEPHNDFIRVYVETGLVGLAAYLWLLGTLVVVAVQGLRSVTGGLPRGVVAGFAGALAAFLLLSLVSNVITQLVILWYFATLAAAAVAAPRLATDRAAIPH